MTTPTTTAQATVLTEEQLQHAIETVHDFGDNIMIDHYFGMIVAHIDALTEQVRVLAEALEGIAVTLEHENDPFLERDNAHDLLADIRDITDTTLAALEGSGASE